SDLKAELRDDLKRAKGGEEDKVVKETRALIAKYEKELSRRDSLQKVADNLDSLSKRMDAAEQRWGFAKWSQYFHGEANRLNVDVSKVKAAELQAHHAAGKSVREALGEYEGKKADAAEFKSGDKVKVKKAGSNFDGCVGVVEYVDSQGTVY